jgi:hypothetical protein
MAKRIGAQLLRYAVAITIWPVMVLILLEDKLNIGSGARVPERVFAVKRADLLETLTVEQIEARERVQDPLGAVPNLPFGPPVRLTSPTGMGHGHPGSSGELGGFQNGQTSFYFA